MTHIEYKYLFNHEDVEKLRHLFQVKEVEQYIISTVEEGAW